MAKVVNDNIQNNSPKSLDAKYTKFVDGAAFPYSSIAEVNAMILSSYRSVGLTVLVNISGTNTEYWYKDGVANTDLVEKITDGVVIPVDSVITDGSSNAITSNAVFDGLALKVDKNGTDRLLTSVEGTKLSGIASGATVNSTDGFLLSRANHTGTQNQSTITNLTTDLSLKAPIVSPTFSGTVILPSSTSIGSVSNLEIGYLDGVTSSIQSQINSLPILTTVASLRSVTSPTTAARYYTTDFGKEGFWYYDNNDTTSLDNTGTILVSGSFRFKRIFSDYLNVLWFGAKGDETTDNTIAIQAAINFASNQSIIGGGKIFFPSGSYAISSAIIIEDNVSIEGEIDSSVQTSVGQLKGIVKIVAINSMNYMATNIINHERTDQLGLESGTNKNICSSSFKNIIFDGNNKCQWGIYWFECWNGVFESIRIINCISYGLATFHCNQLLIRDCHIRGALFDTLADSIMYGNTFVGGDDYPAISLRTTTYNSIGNNLIFFGVPHKSKYIKKVVSYDSTNNIFIVDPSQTSVLTEDPSWNLKSGSGVVVWNATTKVITYTVSNYSSTSAIGTSLSSNTTYNGSTYKITGIAKLLSGSTSSSKTISFTSGNNLQQYGTLIVTNGTSATINITFTCVQANSNPLYIRIPGASSGTDNWEFDDVRMEITSEPPFINKDPYLLYVSNDFLPSNLLGPNRTSLNNSYYIKYFSGSTFQIASSRANYNSSTWIVPIGSPTYTDLYIGPPKGVITITDGCVGNTIFGNKVEDVESNAILIRGSYENIFTGNAVYKARVSDGVKLISVEAGSFDNQFTGNIISKRLSSSSDKSEYCIYIDSTSGRNHFSGNRTGNARVIDISDNYIGASQNLNRWDEQTLDNSSVFIKKSIDYLPSIAGVRIPIGTLSPLRSITYILNSPEFTLFFKDVVFYDSNISKLFIQDDGTSLTGYVSITKNASNRIEYRISNVLIAISSVISLNVAYDISIVKTGDKSIFIYIDGALDVTGISSTLEAPISTGVVSIIGGGFTSQTGEMSIGKFRYYSDSMIASEVATLSTGIRYETMKWNSSNVAIDGSFTTNPQSTFTVGSGTVSRISSGGIDGVESSLRLTADSSTNNSILALGTLDRTSTYRISTYAKTSNTSLLSALRFVRDTNYTVVLNLNTIYNKIVFYMPPSYKSQTNTLNTTSLRIGGVIEDNSTGNTVFTNSIAGTVDFSRFRVDKNGPPLEVEYDFTRQDVIIPNLNPSNLNNIINNIFYTGRKIIVSSRIQILNTASTTSENVIFSTNIPAYSLSLKGTFEFSYLGSCTNSVNNKILKIKIGSNIILSHVVTTSDFFRGRAKISNRNSFSSQIGGVVDIDSGIATSGGTSYTSSTFAINTTIANTLTITLQNSNSGEVCALEDFELVALN